MLDDLIRFIDETEKLYPDNKNRFVLGYSLGGLYTNLINLKKPNYFNGMILLAPAVQFDFTKNKYLIPIAQLLNRIYPKLGLFYTREVPSKHKEIIENITNDPLIYKGKFRVGTAISIMDSLKYIYSNLDKVSTPYFLIHGKDDTVIPYQHSSDFHNKTKIQDKTFLLVDNIDHYIPKDKLIDAYFKDIIFWMKERLH